MEYANRSTTALAPLRRWEKIGLILILLGIMTFGVLVEIRSAFLTHRRTDLGCYLRAAWAVRSGENMYEVTEGHGWHYNYPPLFAITLVPLAEAPAEAEAHFVMPYAVSVAIWFLLSLLFLWLSVDWIAKLIEQQLGGIPKGCRRWWYMRTIPVYILIAPIGCTLSRGQVNLLLVFLLAGFLVALARKQIWQAGLWLAGSMILKVMPIFLFLVPVWRRDYRLGWTTCCGLLLGVMILPTAILGWQRTAELNQQFWYTTPAPALGLSNDQTRTKELTTLGGSHNQSILATIHNYRNWGEVNKPEKAASGTKLAHLIIVALFTAITCFAYGWKPDTDPIRLLLFVGSLIGIMTIASPSSHTHYFCFLLPSVMGLMAVSYQANPERLLPDTKTLLVLAFGGICFALPMLPIWEHRREAGLPILGTLILWSNSIHHLRRTSAKKVLEQSERRTYAQAA